MEFVRFILPGACGSYDIVKSSFCTSLHSLAHWRKRGAAPGGLVEMPEFINL